MTSRMFARSLAALHSVVAAGLLLTITGCQQEDSETLATYENLASALAVGAVSVAGDIIRALLAAFLF